ncbi:hypothetical protein ACJJTC_019731 [Scirpophaga incertulas]
MSVVMCSLTMAPNVTEEETAVDEGLKVGKLIPQYASPVKHKILYLNLIYFAYWHLAAPYGVYLCFAKAKWWTVFFGFLCFIISEVGITAGAHRLWSHRCYKAKMPLQILLMLFNSVAFQNNVIHWARDHRLHHKYCDTDADPHNASRGFFFSHVGWLLTRKNKEVIKYGKTMDMSDLENNPVLKFQKDYAALVFTTFCFILPVGIPMYIWGETFNVAWHVNLLRYTLSLNFTFLVNSAAHLWGFRPYDKSIFPAQNLYVSFLTLGEGFHNYHHVFPWDYKTAELGNNKLNFTTLFINMMARIGWAYDLKTVPHSVVRTRALKSGDGTNLWGWGDEDMSNKDKLDTKIS